MTHSALPASARTYLMELQRCKASIYMVFVLALLRLVLYVFVFFFSSRRRHTRSDRDWSSDVCSSDLCSPLDVLLGYASSGLHTNGYTLARQIVFDRMKLDVGDRFPDTNRTVGEVLLEPHRSYFNVLRPVLDDVHALAHITGGGIAGNLIRVLPEGCEAVVDAGSWACPPLFRVWKQAGD